MQILAICLKNIKSHRDKELHFVKGINVLSGINGAGKSTIFEAIGYALFGVDARDFVGNIERFITIGQQKGEIAVTFAADDGNTYRVSRGVGTGSRWLLAGEINGAFEVENHAGAPETEARLKELLGLDSGRSLADQYKLVIGPFQNEFLGPFVYKQPTKRREAFDEILGIDAWRKTYKGTSTLQTAVRHKIGIVESEIEGKREQIVLLQEREKELSNLIIEAAALQKILSDKITTLTETDKKLTKLDVQEKKIHIVTSEIQVLENRIHDHDKTTAELTKRVHEAQIALEALEKNQSGKDAFEAAEIRLKVLREQEKQKRLIEGDIHALEKESTRLAQHFIHESREIQRTGQQLAGEEKRLQEERNSLVAGKNVTDMAVQLPALKNEAEKLHSEQGILEGKRAGLAEGKFKLSEGVCPFFKEQCQNISDKAPRDVFTSKIDALTKEMNSLSKRLAELVQQIAAAEKARDKLAAHTIRAKELEKQLQVLTKKQEENTTRQATLGKIGKLQEEVEKKIAARKKDINRFNGLDAEITLAEKVRTEHLAARDAFFANQKDARDLNNRRDSLKKMLAICEKLRQNLSGKRETLIELQNGYDSKHHTEARSAKERFVADIAAIQQKMTDQDKDRLRLVEEIKKMKRIQEEIHTRIAAKKRLENKEELVKFLRNNIFNNVSTQLSERLREEISLRADKLYRIISETDEELCWGDRYQIVLRDMENGNLRERTDDQLSGGQLMSAVVSLRLALLQTIGARVAFFDEPTSNLDAVRRENMAHAFRAIDIGREEVTEHWYDQLFLISHDVAFTEITDQVIALE
jgi:exonuclease SbcC